MYIHHGRDSLQDVLMKLAQIASELQHADAYAAEDLMAERDRLLQQLKTLRGNT